ncbi:MAG: PHP domain-containing protein, partial [Lachnospiraceae bacterium]
MIPLYYDLHLHSCLSPCGDDEMTPSNIVGFATLNGLDVIAVTDHNSCKNCLASMKCGEAYGITVIPGMELCTSEEVHVLCLFPSIQDAMDFDTYVYKHLIPITNKEDIFGRQQICNEDDEITGTVRNLLINSTDISFDSVSNLVSEYHGVWIPSHIDKNTTSLLSNLGFVPPDASFTCFEIQDLTHLHKLRKDNPYLNSCNVICNSDAHYLKDIRKQQYQLHARSNSIV